MKTVVSQIIDQLSCIDAILAPESKVELIHFVSECQNPDGGFQNRDGSSDPYYSFFGFLIASSLGLSEELSQLKKYVLQTSTRSCNSLADTCALTIMDALLSEKRGRHWGKALKFLRQFKANKGHDQMSYVGFLTLLTVETLLGRPTFMVNFSRRILKKVKENEAMPCSQIAALMVLKKELGLPFHEEQKLLPSYFGETGSFRIYTHMANSDLLSTAVALYVMKRCNIDRRLYAPASIRFVESLYAEGAFLSGDVDSFRDLEYTFYGMLALTSVS